jgi:hypothetical protein
MWNLFWKRTTLPCSRLKNARLYSSIDNNNNANHFDTHKGTFNQDDSGLILNLPDVEETYDKKEQYNKTIELYRDVNRFSKFKIYKKYHELHPIKYVIKDQEYSSKISFFRKTLAKYGKISGVDEVISWPGKTKLTALIKDKNEVELSLNQKINILIERKRNEINNITKL